ncbi:ATP-binding protein [Sulfitobacter sp. S190]|uniref:ATP-binding protein n=1 Tax=Sulfitobacter sp. S190 TaxID=2867022 RepID=UPI0021A2BC9D|nr:ATP-binding protein [Sulfitobacter sp. S190]UWR23995.1 response regulator [Sulfitobacter sp. S190]
MAAAPPTDRRPPIPANRLALLGILGALALIGAWVVEAPMLRLALGAAGAALIAVGAVLCLTLRARRPKPGGTSTAIPSATSFLENDRLPGFVIGSDGVISSCNPAAAHRFEAKPGLTLASVLKNQMANPGPTLFRLQSRADATGSAREEIVTRSALIDISTHRIGPDTFAWRVDLREERQIGQGGPDARMLPAIMVGRSGAVLSMNTAARRFVGGRSKTIDEIFAGKTPVHGSVVNVTTIEGDREALVALSDAGAGRRMLHLMPPPAGEARKEVSDWHMLQEIPIPMIKLAPDGTVQSFNIKAAKLIGVALVEGVNLSELMEGLGRAITDWLDDTLEGRLMQKSEFLRLTRNDREVFVQVTLNPVTEADNQSLIAVLHDATELKSLEAQFVQSQKMQAIGQLAGGVAHDFNNLLTAISGHCDLLLLRHDAGNPDYADLVQINQNANRAATLVGQLLAFSRKQTLRPETLDMRDTLADLTHLLNRLVGEKVSLSLSHDPVLHPIRADKRQLEQVLMNLVVNARDAMPAGGEIRIQTECTTLTTPLLRDQVTVPVGEYVTLRVQDDGIGIPHDKLQKVFEPFFTTKRTGEGTGLGLSTAYGIVKQTGGYIFVDSDEGVGTCFTLYFPVLKQTEDTLPSKQAKAPEAAAKQADGVILLVEDEAPVRAFASRALRLRGFTVLEADSAEAALETLQDASLNIDVFVTDVVMPGMDGPSWVREALKKRPDVRVVFVSGYAEDSLGEAQKKIPNSVFLPKPFSLTDLTDTVHRQLH